MNKNQQAMRNDIIVAREHTSRIPATNETARLRAEALRALDALFEVVAQMGEGA